MPGIGQVDSDGSVDGMPIISCGEFLPTAVGAVKLLEDVVGGEDVESYM